MIYDADDNVLTSTALTVPPDDEREFTVKVDCVADYQITASADNADVGVFCRADPLDAWTDILAGGLAIGSFAPSRKTFYFKITVDVGADPTSEIVTIRVARV
jgi:hypothetical protein